MSSGSCGQMTTTGKSAVINILLLLCMWANAYSYALVKPKPLSPLMLLYGFPHSPFYI